MTTLRKLCNVAAVASLVALVSCAQNQGGTIIYSGSGSEQATGESAGEPASGSDPFVRQRILADMLYEARLAYDDNRLMTPPGNNAYDGYRAVLDFDPENEIALQGIRDIVLRYVTLARSAIKVGQLDNAEDLLNRADRIGGNQSAIADARRELEQARQTNLEYFTLDPGELDKRSLEIMVELGEIGEYIRDKEAMFLINARTDEEGRWIYKTMREAVGGYRLRGNIALDAEPSIQVAIPRS